MDDKDDLTGSVADFTISLSGLKQMTVTEIYFYDGVVFEMGAITGSHESVNYIDVDDPPDAMKLGNLPDIGPAKAVWSVFEEADPLKPVVGNGVDLDESVTIAVTVTGTVAQMLSAMNTLITRTDDEGKSYEMPGLFVGVHVQNFTNGGSESFITWTEGGVPPDAIVPAPGAALLGMMGFGLMGWWKRRMA